MLRSLLGLALCLAGIGVARATPDLSIYGNLPGFETAAMSPSGDRVALIGTIGPKRQLVVLGRDLKPIASAEIGADTKLRDLLWAGDQMVLLETSVTSSLGAGFTAAKAELFSMMVVPLGGGKPWTVFEGDRLVRGGIHGFYGVNARAGKWYGYFGGITLDQGSSAAPYLASTKPALYEVDLQTRRARRSPRRAESDTGYRDWLVDPDGNAQHHARL
ncbi:MAG: hypothetical protein WDN31_02215 [Hyphomicrobium sp.]